MSEPMPHTVEIPAIYSKEELERLYSDPWKASHRDKFIRDLSKRLARLHLDDDSPLDLDPQFVRWLLQFMVRHREVAQELIKISKTYKYNLPRISEEGFQQSMDLALVKKIMRS